MRRTLLVLITLLSPAVAVGEIELHVDAERGKDNTKGTARRPLRTLAAALAKLPEPLEESVTIHLAAGEHQSTGGEGSSERSLALVHRMRPGVHVRFLGPEGDAAAVLAWEGSPMVDVREGEWRFQRLRIGTFSTRQRRGVVVRGPARAVLEGVTFRLRSHSDVGIRAERGGWVCLRGRIQLNEHLHEEAQEETFSGLLAVDHGVIEFDEHSGSHLDLGNGSLSVRYYGRIRLGCESARITSWTKSNNLTISSGGRIDLGGTPTLLRAVRKNNTPIGLEHDGHILAEDARIEIVGPNDSAIALQKASTFTCNDVLLKGEFEYAMWASSGSLFVGRFLSDVSKLKAKTGAQIHVEKIDGEVGEVVVESGGLISLPDRVVR